MAEVQQEPKPKLQQLHESLVAAQYDVPTDYNVFERNLQDPHKMKMLHQALVKDQYDVPTDYAVFERNLRPAAAPAPVEKKSPGQAGSAPSGAVTSPGVDPAAQAQAEQRFAQFAQGINTNVQPNAAQQDALPPAQPTVPNIAEAKAKELVSEVYEKDRPTLEKNPLVSGGKSFWKTMSYDLPTGIAATTALGMRDLREPGEHFITKEGQQLWKENQKYALEGRKQLLAWAEQRQAEGAEFSKDLINTMDKIEDPLDALNWVSSALGNAAGQIPASVATAGLTSFAQETGSIYMDGLQKISREKNMPISEIIEKGLDEPAFAIAYGTAAGLLDKVGATKVMSAFGRQGLQQSLRGRALSMASSGAVEGGTEYTQTFFEQLGKSQVAGKAFDEAFSEASTSEAARERLEALAQGIVGGTGLHGIGQASPKKQSDVDAVTQNIAKIQRGENSGQYNFEGRVPPPAPEPVSAPEPVVEQPAPAGKTEKVMTGENAGSYKFGEAATKQEEYPVVPRPKAGLKEGKNFDYAPNTKLSEEDKATETSFADDLDRNYEDRKEEYIGKFGNVLDADKAKELSEEYSEDPLNKATAVHNPSSSFVQKMYMDLISQPGEETGKKDLVTLVIGGSGAGKTTLINDMGDSDSKVVYDMGGVNEQLTKNQINRALNAKNDVEIKYVTRDPNAAFDSMIERSSGGQRIVPVDFFVKSHVDTKNTMDKIQAAYAKNPRVKIDVVGEEIGDLTADQLKEQLTDKVETLYAEGQINIDQYSQLLGKEPPSDQAPTTNETDPVQPESPVGDQQSIPKAVQQPSSTTEAAPKQASVEGREVEFTWLGNPKKGVVVETKDNGKIVIKSEGTLYPVKPDAVRDIGDTKKLKVRGLDQIDKSIQRMRSKIQNDKENFELQDGKLKILTQKGADMMNKLEKMKVARQKFLDKKYTGEQASTQRHYEPPIGMAKRKKAKDARIQVEPILGGKPKKLRDIVLDLSKSKQGNIYYTKSPSPGRRALGAYSPSTGTTGIKFTGDLNTVAHETGHELDDRYGIVKSIPAAQQQAVHKELMNLAPYGSTPPKGHPNARQYELAEGMAEYIRAWMVNPAQAEKQYPETSAWIKQAVPADALQKMQAFGTDVRTFFGLSAGDQIGSNVQMEQIKKENPVAAFFKSKDFGTGKLTWVDRLAYHVVDRKHFFNKAVDMLQQEQGKKLLPSQDPRVLGRLYMGANEKLDNIFERGLINAKGKRYIDQGQRMTFEWLIEPFENTSPESIKQEQKEAVQYMIAERTLELAQRFKREDIITGIGGGLMKDTDVAKRHIAEFNNYPAEKQARLKEAVRRYQKYADRVLRYLVDKGRLSDAQYAQIKANNTQYVALQRVLEAAPEEEIVVYQGKGGNAALGSAKDVIKKVKGSTALINNPYESLVETAVKSIKEADRNEVMQAFSDLFRVSRQMYDPGVPEIGKLARPAVQADKNTIQVFVNGKPEHWQLQPDLYTAVKNITDAAVKLPWWSTALGKLLRSSVTSFPVFALRNRLRDLQHRMVISDTKPYRGYDIYKDKKTKELTKDLYQNFGGGQAGYYLMNDDFYYKKMDEAVRKLSQEKKSILMDPKRWLKGYNDLLTSGERATRLEEYRSAFKKAKDDGLDDYNAAIFAASKARDLLDFAVAGETMQAVNQVVPFSNAAVQGLAKTYRSAKADPVGFGMRFLLYSVIPSLFMRVLVHMLDKDEEYDNMPDYRRDLFYNIPIGPDLWVSIPKPFEVGVLGSSADRAVSYGFGDENAFKGYGWSVAKSMWPVDEAVMLGGWKPIIEAMTNYDTFRDKHIIPPTEEGKDLDLRGTGKGSRLGQGLQEVTGWLPFTDGLDARYADHIIKGTTSYYGDLALRLSDIGREDTRYPVDWSLTGLVRHDPLYDSKNVQQVMKYAQKRGIHYKDPLLEQLNEMINIYYQTDDPKMKAMQGEEVRRFAGEVMEAFKTDENYSDKREQENE